MRAVRTKYIVLMNILRQTKSVIRCKRSEQVLKEYTINSLKGVTDRSTSFFCKYAIYDRLRCKASHQLLMTDLSNVLFKVEV